MFEEIIITLPLLGAIVSGIVQVIKKAVGEEKMKRFNGIVAIVLGLMSSFLAYYNYELLTIIAVGLMVGLSATGYYELGKHIKK